MQCPNCKAPNPDDAKWCSLCLKPFAQVATSERHLQNEPADAEEEFAWGKVAASLPGQPLPTKPLVRKSENISTWTCPNCQSSNLFSENNCAVCGTSFFDAFKEPSKQTEHVVRSPNVAGVLSVMPGAGHFYLKRTSDGLTRLLLGLWWVSFALFIPNVNSAMAGVRILFGIAFLGLAAISAADAYRVAEDRTAVPLLSRSLIVWTSLTLGSLMLIVAFTSLLSIAR